MLRQAADSYARAAISPGFDAAGRRRRVKRKGRTKAQVRDKLREVVEDLAAGVTAAEDYTVADAIGDFLDQGMKGKSAETISNYRSLAGHDLTPQIGAARLKKLTADELDKWMDGRAAELSNRTLRLVHQILERAIQLPDQAGPGSPHRLAAYVVTSLLAGSAPKRSGPEITPLDRWQVRCEFAVITGVAGLGEQWAPRDQARAHDRSRGHEQDPQQEAAQNRIA